MYRFSIFANFQHILNLPLKIWITFMPLKTKQYISDKDPEKWLPNSGEKLQLTLNYILVIAVVSFVQHRKENFTSST